MRSIPWFAALGALCLPTLIWGVEAAQAPIAGDAPPLNLQGNVLSMKEYVGNDLSALTLSRIVLFDKKRRAVSEKIFDATGAAKSETKFIYADSGPIVEIQGLGPNNILAWRYAYSYDDKGRLTAEASYDGSGALEWRYVYKYNDDGQLSEKIDYGTGEAVKLQETYQYGDKKLLTLRTTLYADGKLLKRVAFSYDDSGRIAREEHYDANGMYEVLLNTYGERGNLIATKVTGPDGTPKRSVQKAYDDGGKLTQEKDYEAASATPQTVVSYAYDDKGNWIRRTETPGAFTVREISYEQ